MYPFLIIHVFSLEDYSLVMAFTETRSFLLNYFIKCLYISVPSLNYMFSVMTCVSFVSLVLAFNLDKKGKD